MAFMPGRVLVGEPAAVPRLGAALAALDEATERVAVHQLISAALPCDDRATAPGVSASIDGALAGGATLSVLDPAHAGADLAAIDASPDVKAGMARALAAGLYVVAPNAKAEAFWTLDPRRGTAVDETREGRHGPREEYWAKVRWTTYATSLAWWTVFGSCGIAVTALIAVVALEYVQKPGAAMVASGVGVAAGTICSNFRRPSAGPPRTIRPYQTEPPMPSPNQVVPRPPGPGPKVSFGRPGNPNFTPPRRP
jgi:hypothetical protein